MQKHAKMIKQNDKNDMELLAQIKEKYE